jgi:hypothetical protein
MTFHGRLRRARPRVAIGMVVVVALLAILALVWPRPLIHSRVSTSLFLARQMARYVVARSRHGAPPPRSGLARAFAEQFDDADAVAVSDDAWGEPLRLIVTSEDSAMVIRAISAGPNRLFECGYGDDIVAIERCLPTE